MTPEEITHRINTRVLHEGSFEERMKERDAIEEEIKQLVKEEVEKEREAFKLIAVKRWVVSRDQTAYVIADEIEARRKE